MLCICIYTVYIYTVECYISLSTHASGSSWRVRRRMKDAFMNLP